ncbi:MAG: HAD family hydrolase [Nitrososphaerales archaeon]
MTLMAVLFDFDGTIIDLNFKYAESRIAIKKILKGLGFEESVFSLQDTAQTILEKAEKQMREMHMKMGLCEVKNRIWPIIDKFEVEAINDSKLVQGTKPILDFLSKKGIRKGLVSNSGRSALQLALTRHRLGKAFDTIVTRDEVNRLKPYGEGIELALKILKISNENAIYLGDGINDVLAAKDAKVRSIAIGRWAHSKEKLAQLSPDYVVTSLNEAMNLLKQLIEEA